MNGLVLIVLCASFSGAFSSNWHYGNESHWPEKCRTGKSQSPINLDKREAEVGSFEKFHFNNYDVKLPGLVKNNGHSVQLNLNVGIPIPKLTGGGLSKEYTLDHLHFHWKSEHTMDNYRFPLEVHLVHYASEYGDLSNALKYVDGVAVLGVFYDLSPDDDNEFQSVLEVIENVEKHPNSVKNVTKVKIDGFLPRDTAGFYRYNGSLTTPECTEAVIWTVFTNTIPASYGQLRHFESVQSEEGTLEENFRSLQTVGNRTVYLKISPLPHSSASSLDTSFIFSIMLLLLLVIM